MFEKPVLTLQFQWERGYSQTKFKEAFTDTRRDTTEQGGIPSQMLWFFYFLMQKTWKIK